MKILQVNDRINLQGGTEEYVPYISKKLAGRGHEVAVLFEEGPSFAKASEGKEGISLVKLPLDDFGGLEKLIRELKPDVANLHNIQNPHAVQKISQLVPTLRYIHDHRVFCPGFSKFYLSDHTACPLPFSARCAVNAYAKKCATRRPRQLFKKMRAKPFELEVNRALPKILVASEYMKGELIKNKFESRKIVVMPDPIESPKEVIDIEYGDFILFVGRLTVEKGVEYLLHAFSRASKKRSSTMPQLKLKVVGDGPQRLGYQQLTTDLGIANRVTFTGWLPYAEVCRLYAKCRFLVFPSVWPEPYGRTGPEAMMFKKPVIGFAVGAVSEWLKDNKNGFLLSPKDMDGLVEKMTLLWNNTDLTRSLGEDAQKFIGGTTDPEDYVAELEDVYRSLL